MQILKLTNFIKNLLSIKKIERINFRNDINSLRAVAVVGVVLYHLDIRYFGGGYLGVDIFFVISGYLISNIIFSDLNQDKFSLKNFYIRRVRRILPAVLSTVVITIPFAYFLLLPRPTIEYLNSIIYTLFFLSNVYFSKLDFYNSEPADLMPFLHTWSLGIEEQFYLIFPIMSLILYKFFKDKIIIFFILIFTISLYINVGSSFVKFYLLHFRAWQLVAGVILCIVSQNLRIKYTDFIGFLIIFYCYFKFDDEYILEIEPRILITLGTALIIFSNNKNSLIERFSKNKIIYNLGLTSFSLYLLHQPIFAFGRIYSNKQTLLLGNIKNPNYFSELIFQKYLPYYVLLLLVITNLNYKYVEKKFLNKSTKANTLLLPLILILAIAAIGLSNDGYKFRYSNQSEDILQYQDNRTNSLSLQGESCWERKKIERICEFDRNSNNSVYNFGDSHAGVLSLFLSTSNDLKQYNYFDITGCIKYIENMNASKECEERGYDLLSFNRYLKNINNSTVIYFINTEMEIKKHGEVEFRKYFETTVDIFLQNNNKLILIYPVPHHPFSIPEQFIQKELDFYDNVSMPVEYFTENKEIKLTYQIYDSLNNENIYKVYPKEIFCDSFISLECVGAFDGSIFYYDTNHLTKTGAKLVGDQIVEIINKKN